METKFWKATALVLAVFALGLIVHAPARAEYDNIKSADVYPAVTIAATAGSSTTQTNPFRPLPKTTTQSCMITGTGTDPNFKVELLVSIDGTTFVKPETGGDLGTFTDQNPHIVAISVPLSPGGHKAKVTELGAVNSISVSFVEASQ